MLQRIQTLYLVVAITAISLMLFYPLSEILVNTDLYLVMEHNRIFSSNTSEFAPMSTWPVTVLISTVLLISLVTIFLFKKRIFQMRLCVFNIILMFGIVVLVYFYTKYTLGKLNGESSLFLWPLMMPFVGIIMTYLALKRIQKDENLVRSYDRIR